MYEGNNRFAGTVANNTPSRPSPASIAQEVATSVYHLADRASTLASALCAKLEPVMTCAGPTCKGEEEKAEREYPPYFNDLRSQLQHIANSLSSIEDMISRTAI